MAVPIRVTLTGQQAVRRTLLKVRDELRREIIDTVNASAIAVDAGAKRNVVVDTGRLRSSISPKLARRGGEVLSSEVRVTAAYAPFVEFGTSRTGAATNQQKLPAGYRHGARHKLPPDSALRGWTRRVIRPPAKELAAVTYLVRRAISRRPGLPARPFLGPAFQAERPKFERRMRRVLDRVRA